MSSDLSRRGSADISASDWSAMREMALVMVQSGFLPASVKTDVQALAIIITGRELGYGPMTSIRLLHVINQKVGLSAKAMLSLAYRDIPGFQFEIIESSASICRVRARRSESHNWTEAQFSSEEAHRAGLIQRSPVWKAYPADMCRARATTRVLDSVAADATNGIRSVEDLTMDVERGDYIPGYEDVLGKENSIAGDARDVLAGVEAKIDASAGQKSTTGPEASKDAPIPLQPYPMPFASKEEPMPWDAEDTEAVSGSEPLGPPLETIMAGARAVAAASVDYREKLINAMVEHHIDPTAKGVLRTFLGDLGITALKSADVSQVEWKLAYEHFQKTVAMAVVPEVAPIGAMFENTDEGKEYFTVEQCMKLMLKARTLFPNRKFFTSNESEGIWFIDPDIIKKTGLPARAFLLSKIEHPKLAIVIESLRDAIASVQNKSFRRA